MSQISSRLYINIKQDWKKKKKKNLQGNIATTILVNLREYRVYITKFKTSQVPKSFLEIIVLPFGGHKRIDCKSECLS